MATTVTKNQVGAQFTLVITESSAQPGTLNNWADQMGTRGIRVTQEYVEVVAKGIPHVRVTQVPIEVVARGIPNARITQVYLEVVGPRLLAQPHVRIMT